MEAFIFTSALKDYLRLRRVWPWLLMAAFCFVVGWVWVSMSTTPKPQDIYSQVSLTLVFKIVALAAAIFSTAVIGQEIEQKTIVYLVTRPVQRWKLILMRSIAAAVVVALIAIVTALAVSLATNRLGFVGNSLFWRDAIALTVGAFAYCGLFVLASLWFNRAMIICLMFAFGWETLVPNLPGDAYYLSIFSYTSVIAQHPSPGGDRDFLTFLTGQLGDNLLSVGSAWTVMIILIGGTAAASAWWFSNFEYVPREDTE